MKKIQLLLSSLLLALPFGAFAQSTHGGDVNGDGKIDVSDVTEMIVAVLNSTPLDLAVADVNGDGKVNVSDVTQLISMVLNGSGTPVDEGDWVDLGLPSGTIWATRNVGASSPEDYGDYFAWGETSPKSVYNWDTYQWYKSYQDANGYWHRGYTKYCTSNSYGLAGFVDNKTELDPSDDAACAHYPGGRMPSYNQIKELCDNCNWTWTQQNGVNGQLVTGPNGNTMFLPAAGGRWGGFLYYAGSYGYYWSRTLYSYLPSDADYLHFSSGGWLSSGYRYVGFTVRAVRAD